MAIASFSRSVPELFSDLVTQFTTLLRKEGQLARAEIEEKVSDVGSALAMIVVGAVLLIPALVILLESAVAALEEAGLQAPWAALAVGGLVLLIGLILLLVGTNRLKAERLLPNRTIQQLQRNASVAKYQVRKDHETERAAGA